MAQAYDEPEVVDAEIVEFQPRRQGVPYRRSAVVHQPETPQARRSGPLGLWTKRQDEEHIDAVWKFQQLAAEVDTARANGIQLRVRGVHQAGEAGRTLEQIYNTHPSEALGGQMVADLASRNASEIREDDQLFMDAYRTAAVNILNRRR